MLGARILFYNTCIIIFNGLKGVILKFIIFGSIVFDNEMKFTNIVVNLTIKRYIVVVEPMYTKSITLNIENKRTLVKFYVTHILKTNSPYNANN